MMDDLDVQDGELLDEVGNLKFSPPPMKKSDTRDSISSVDSDVSLSFDRRGSKGEDADVDFSDSGSSEFENTEAVQISSTNRITAHANIQLRPKPKTCTINTEIKTDNSAEVKDSAEIVKNDTTNEEDEKRKIDQSLITTSSSSIQRTSNETDEGEIPPCSDELAEKIAAQVEFYFSDENIVKDAFLLKHVKRNKEGYVSLKLISSFKRVKHLSRDWRIVATALRTKSLKLEVNEQGTKLRRRDPLPLYDQTVTSRTVLAARLPIDKLSIEAVAELFGQCGEIVLVRVLRPGHPIPSEVRQAIAKRPELASSEEYALIEFTDSAGARAAMCMTLGDARIYELPQSSSTGKKRKQTNQKKQPQQQQIVSSVRKNAPSRMARENVYNSSSCASGSEAEDSRILRMNKQSRNHSGCHHLPFAAPNVQGSPSRDTWLSRRLSSCSITGIDNTANEIILRRLSSCSGSGSNSDSSSHPIRRFSSCSSNRGSGSIPPGIYGEHISHNGINKSPQLYPAIDYYTQGRRFSCCAASSSVPGSPTTGYNVGYDYANTFYGQTGRRGSADCGPFLRRLSSCSRDSGFFDPSNRRLSSCSSSSDSCSGQFRPRSNSGFVLMAHLPEGVTRLPSGPDGTRGFGRLVSNVSNNHHNANPSVPTVVPSCR